MPKWTPYISGERAVVVGGDYIYCYALTHEESVKFAAAHNADIDALTAERDELQGRIDIACERLESFCAEVDEVERERDELQRRLSAVVMEHIRTAELKCYCEFDRDHERTMECEYCEEVAALRAIAEGRTPCPR